jgi:sialate O-acetylesterase
MVLQRDQPVPIWGQAEPGEEVTVQFAGQEKHAAADKQGHWQVRLKSLKASALPADLTIRGSNTLTLTNILVGEVWFCSGQSNMEKPLGEKKGQKPVKNYQEELKSGDLYPNIRLFNVAQHQSLTPTNDVKAGAWAVCSSNALDTIQFSALGYFFGREIHTNLNVPVGLIASAWGGTRIEPWTPAEAFLPNPRLKQFAQPLGTNKLVLTTPSALYNGMVAPAIPFAIRGVLWYQGEANCMEPHDGAIYTEKMEAMVSGWRKAWNQGKFPFFYVQIAPFHYFEWKPKARAPYPEALPEIWEAQTAALRIPNSGMAVITDLVPNVKDIHPTRKAEVGHRLALIALAKTYGRHDLIYSGPMFKSARFSGNKAVIKFTDADGGLVSGDAKPLTWFSIAGSDGKFAPADATIQGETVVVTSPEVSQPTAVRFGWNEAAQPNLFNKAGLPASPFRTDRLSLGVRRK